MDELQAGIEFPLAVLQLPIVPFDKGTNHFLVELHGTCAFLVLASGCYARDAR